MARIRKSYLPEKTRLIDELVKAPVKSTGRRLPVRGDILQVAEESVNRSTWEMGGAYAEEYTFAATLGAKFHVHMFSHDVQVARERYHKEMLRSVIEQVYGEVRHAVHAAFIPLQDITDFQAREDLSDILRRILDMTEL